MVTDPLAPAVEVIGAFHHSAPVDVEGIAAALGIDVVFDPSLPDDISGKIERPGIFDDRYRITVNGRHGKNRQRFTIAHELAHYALHRSLIGDGIVDDGLYRSTKGSVIERQANSYAATILMPARLVRQHYQQGATEPEDMARIFGVSTEVARIRMRELRFIPPF
ncbi:ImmA/IrrE family metallo-endopeptidase [Xanthobacter sp. TB0136]|uniref:ImmA/IrrE family metallo-endopeptidase n=1 Tax=Xanthobacter sp. TB0136 TaxID=3459177 RepID=UPI0040396458